MAINTFLLAVFVIGVSGQQSNMKATKGSLTRFEYEYKVLGKIVVLQQRLRGLNKVIREQADMIKGLSAKIKDTSNDFASLQYHTGSTYIRWGRTSCPGNGSELVYDGYVGGSIYISYGGAANPLCLPRYPDWGHYQETADTFAAYVVGAKYQFTSRSNYMKFFPEADQSKPLANQDVPCAVCRSPRASVIMVPAKNRCHGGWSLEYTGYIMAGYHGSKAASEYICVDGAPETVRGGATTNVKGHLLFLAEGRCGYLKCPPYVNGRELTCAVCSK